MKNHKNSKCVLNKIVQKEHSKEHPVDTSDIDFEKADALTDEEIEERAKKWPWFFAFHGRVAEKIKMEKKN